MRYADDFIARHEIMTALEEAFEPHIKTAHFEGSKHALLTSGFNQEAYAE